jgi:cytochrome c peroxidase
MTMKYILSISIFAILLIFAACDNTEGNPDIDLRNIAYSPTSYAFPTTNQSNNQYPKMSPLFPAMTIPADNPMTLEGIELGRRLFYDPILSADSTQSCSSCHQQQYAFTDGLQFSTGIDGIAGTRNSMALVNLGYNSNGFFWDGRSSSLEQQAKEPIENPIELHDTWVNVETKLRRSPMYREHFRKAFGIEWSSEISSDLATKALAQFMRSLISYRSLYDKTFGYGLNPFEFRPTLSEAEERGRVLFFQSNDVAGDDPQCSHCHNSELFTNNAYRNNGLDAATSVDDFPDLGFGGVTGFNNDKGKFRTTTLRNIELTAPYMHDGRFTTLEEVLDHYNEHVKESPTLDINLKVSYSQHGGLLLSAQDKADIIAFLKTLTDREFINNPAHSNPF